MEIWLTFEVPPFTLEFFAFLSILCPVSIKPKSHTNIIDLDRADLSKITLSVVLISPRLGRQVHILNSKKNLG